MVTQGVFGHYDIHCGRSMTQVVHWVCGLEGTPAGEVRRAAELAMAGKMAGEVAGAAVREMAGDGGKEVLAAVLARGGERWVMEGVGYWNRGERGMTREAVRFAREAARMAGEKETVAAALRALGECPGELEGALFEAMRRLRGDGGEGGHNGDHKDDGDEDGHSHKEGDKDNGYEDDGDHKDGHSHKEGDKNNGHKSNEDGHSHNGHKDGHMNGPVDGLKEGLIKNPLITPIKNPLITPIKNPLITPIKNPLITPINTPLNSPNKAIIDLLDLLADLPAISPLRAFLHNPVSLPTLFPPSFPPLPLAAGNLPVLLLLRFLLEFDPNSVISLQPLLPALPANSDALPDFARNRPFFRLCREYPLLPLFLHQYLPAGVSL